MTSTISYMQEHGVDNNLLGCYNHTQQREGTPAPSVCAYVSVCVCVCVCVCSICTFKGYFLVAMNIISTPPCDHHEYHYHTTMWPPIAGHSTKDEVLVE